MRLSSPGVCIAAALTGVSGRDSGKQAQQKPPVQTRNPAVAQLQRVAEAVEPAGRQPRPATAAFIPRHPVGEREVPPSAQADRGSRSVPRRKS